MDITPQDILQFSFKWKLAQTSKTHGVRDRTMENKNQYQTNSNYFITLFGSWREKMFVD